MTKLHIFFDKHALEFPAHAGDARRFLALLERSLEGELIEEQKFAFRAVAGQSRRVLQMDLRQVRWAMLDFAASNDSGQTASDASD